MKGLRDDCTWQTTLDFKNVAPAMLARRLSHGHRETDCCHDILSAQIEMAVGASR